ncbi:MAG: TIGR02147 family protein [Halobacteriovoraceae bacterium]|nr:TIGR02147 family protein [Halobacteriovoraceae bacterium]
MIRPNVFAYANYKQYIEDMMSYKKGLSPNYSYRKLSKDCGYTTSDHFRQIIKGKKKMGQGGPEKIIKVFNLKTKEGQFFKDLVDFNQAKNHEQRNKYLKTLLTYEEFRLKNPLMEAQYLYFSKWYYLAIRELAQIISFKDDPEWIASALNPAISPAQAVEALINLQKLEYLERNEFGFLVQGGGKTIDMSGEIFSTGAINYHFEMIDKAKESIERFDREHRNLTTLTIPFNLSRMEKMKELIYEFQKQLIEQFEGDVENDQIYQLNIQCFPLSNKIK